MRFPAMYLGAFAVCASVSFAARPARADEPRYVLANGSIVIQGDAGAGAVRVDCTQTLALAQYGGYLYVACGDGGSVLYVLTDPRHPTLAGRATAPCFTLSPEGACGPAVMAPQPPPQAPPLQSQDPTMVFVHVNAAGSRLVRHRGAPICDAPCDILIPRDGRYDIIVDGRRAPVTLEAASDHANIDVVRESVPRTKTASIVLGASLGAGLGLVLGGFALDQAANGFSDYCSGWFCMSDAAVGHFFGVFLEVLGGAVAIGGTIAALVLFAVPSNRVNARVSRDSSPPRVRWTPTFGASAHGGSLGLHLAF